jgi:hypothetical protein
MINSDGDYGLDFSDAWLEKRPVEITCWYRLKRDD